MHAQKENWRLRQHMLDLRRAARRAACNITTKDTLLTFPEVEHVLQANETLIVEPAVGEHHAHRCILAVQPLGRRQQL